ncbi:MAG: hypothetical protein WCL44_00050 [bacterium]
MTRLLLKILLLACGLGLLPFCAAATWAVVSLIGSLRPESILVLPVSIWALLAGLGLWLVVYFALPRPVRSYVLAHELTHALWASLMGAEVRGISLAKESGSVVVSKSNILITLAPYFFPLYTVIVILVYALLSLFVNTAEYEWVWLFMVGLTWSFHLTFTISAILGHQTDIAEYGHVFSLAFIYLVNVLEIGAWILVVTPASTRTFAVFLLDDSRAVWAWIMTWFF